MKQHSGHVVLAAFALVLMAGSPLFAGTYPTAEFYLNGVGAGNVMAGVYTSPYNAVINPTSINPSTKVATGGTAMKVICDDFGSESYINEYWNTRLTALTGTSSLTAGTYNDTGKTYDSSLKWGGNPGTGGGAAGYVVVNDNAEAVSLGVTSEVKTLTQLQAYDAAALLSINIMAISNGSGNATQLGDYSFALWALFDFNSATNKNPALDQLSPSYSTDEKNAMAYLKVAVDNVVAGKGNDGTTNLDVYLGHYTVNIYSYFNPNNVQPPYCYNVSGGVCPQTPPQEFITVTVPEPTSLAVLGTYALFGGASLLFFGRRRIFGARG